MSQQSEIESQWKEEAKSLISKLINHDESKAIMESFYDESNCDKSIEKNVYLKQIENDLLNDHYASLEDVISDIIILFDNAFKILSDSNEIKQIYQIFKDHTTAYNKANDNEINNETESENDEKLSKKRKRRRSARLAKKNNEYESSEEDGIDIVIKINHKQTKRAKKRAFSAMDDPNDQNQTKIAKISSKHTSPRNTMSEKTESETPIVKKRRRRRRKTVPIETDENENEQNQNNENNDEQPQQQPKNGYNLRSKSKSESVHSPKPKNNEITNKSKSKTKTTKMTKPKLERIKTVPLENDKESSIESISSHTESIINFDDGKEDALCGKFEDGTIYSAKGLCINGHFKPFNQDWIGFDKFDQFKTLPPIIFIGVYDGHGILGHNSSKYVARHLPKQFIFDLYDQFEASQEHVTTTTNNNVNERSESMQDSMFENALKSALSKIDENLREIASNESKMFSVILKRNGCQSRLIDYGTTLNCLISDGQKVHIFNVGDSRCLLIEGFDGKLCYEQISKDHNPSVRQDEQQRIMDANGAFFKQGDDLRMYPKKMNFKEARKKGLAINMTRAVGHCELSKFGLIAEPECFEIVLEEGHEYIFVMASDGIWDVMSNVEVFEVVKAIYCSFVHNQTNSTMEHEIAMEIVESAEKIWKKRNVGDNISCVVTRINKE